LITEVIAHMNMSGETNINGDLSGKGYIIDTFVFVKRQIMMIYNTYAIQCFS